MPGPGRGRPHQRPKSSGPMTAYSGKRRATQHASPGIAAALSFLVPGLGLLYCGRTRAGLLVLVALTPALVALVMYASSFGPVGLRVGIAAALCVDLGQAILTHGAAVRTGEARAG